MNLKKAFQAFNEALKEEEHNFMEAVLADGTVVKWEGELAEGVAISRLTEEGEEISLEDGSFVFEDGTSIEVKGGLVAAVVAIEEEMADEFDSAKFKEEISAMIDEKLLAFAEGLDFAKIEDVEAVSSKLSGQVSEMTDSVLEAMSSIEQPKPTKPTGREAIKDEATQKAIRMASALKKASK